MRPSLPHSPELRRAGVQLRDSMRETVALIRKGRTFGPEWEAAHQRQEAATREWAQVLDLMK